MEMQRRFSAGAIALLLIALLWCPSRSARAAPFDGQRNAFADPSFARVWARSDDARVNYGRGWYWGPAPWFDYAEFYRQGVNGLRGVQYFDKSRMEINDPFGDPASPWFVTNGLLVKELVGGRVQLSADPYDVDWREPADVPVAGNPRGANPLAPSYGDFAPITTLDNGYGDPRRTGERVSATLGRGGVLGSRAELARPETELVVYNIQTNHNIPRVFWNFMGQQGPVLEDGQVRTAALMDWLFVLGLPISDPYWVQARIGERDADVLVQLFERRVLTYVPDNPAGYQVEMGNVGQHYFQWRYPHLGQPWAAPDPDPPLLYASDEGRGYWEVVAAMPNGERLRLTDHEAETVVFSYRRSWDPVQTRVLGDSRRVIRAKRVVYEFSFGALWGAGNVERAQRLSFREMPGYPDWLPNEYNAAVSPDGTKIVFVTDRWQTLPQFYLMTADTAQAQKLTTNPGNPEADGCDYQYPSWSPDGRSLFWESRCDGDYEIYRAELAYQYDSRSYVNATLVNARKLTDNTSDDRFPRVAPDGRQIAFTAYRDGNAEIYLIDADGGGTTRLTNNAASDEAPTWNAAGTRLAFASDRDGDYEIYTMARSGDASRVTDNRAQERWPLWAQ
jgi:hypothetical protein